MGLVKIQHHILDSVQSSIDFTVIPQEYTDLVLVYSVRSADGGNQNDSGQIIFNSDSNTANYTTRQLRGTGSTFEAGDRTTTPGEINGSASTSGVFSSGKAYIKNYTSTASKLVSVEVVSENNAQSAFQHLSAMTYSTSFPITEISLKSEGALNLAQYSSATLYGITAGSDGSTTVS